MIHLDMVDIMGLAHIAQEELDAHAGSVLYMGVPGQQAIGRMPRGGIGKVGFYSYGHCFGEVL